MIKHDCDKCDSISKLEEEFNRKMDTIIQMATQNNMLLENMSNTLNAIVENVSNRE